jgi:hypothetical protein
MTPKEKAEELYKRMYTQHSNIYPSTAKGCALVAVNEILLGYMGNPKVKYWNEVKQEIEKL